MAMRLGFTSPKERAKRGGRTETFSLGTYHRSHQKRLFSRSVLTCLTTLSSVIFYFSPTYFQKEKRSVFFETLLSQSAPSRFSPHKTGGESRVFFLKKICRYRSFLSQVKSDAFFSLLSGPSSSCQKKKRQL